jgi:hypothetical protein
LINRFADDDVPDGDASRHQGLNGAQGVADRAEIAARYQYHWRFERYDPIRDGMVAIERY